MPSNLRYSSFPSSAKIPTAINKTSSSPFKKQKMTLTQTYYLAHTARAKLSKEAARADHNLRLLVGHANLLDGLMLDLAEAEREQESWFNQTVQGNKAAESKHIQWAESLPSVSEEYDEDSSDEDSDDEEMYNAPQVSLRQSTSSMTVTTMEIDMDLDEEEDDEDDEELTLTRTSSRTPPELLHESDSDSEDDSMPPSPPTTEIPLDAFSRKQKQAALYSAKSSSSRSASVSVQASEEDAFYEEGYYLPRRQEVPVY